MGLFKDALLHEQQNQDSRILASGVNAGLWPWNAGQVRIFLNYRIDTMDDELVLETSLLPGLPFTHLITRRSAMGTQEELMQEVAYAALNFFRYRPALPVDDHIILGED